MPDLAMLANNPYLPGNPAFELTPEQKRASMYSAIAHTLIGLGSGISRAGMGAQPWMTGLARIVGNVDDLMKAARINPTTVRTAEQGGYQAGHNDQTANRGLDLWRQRNALQGNPYLQMGGP